MIASDVSVCHFVNIDSAIAIYVITTNITVMVTIQYCFFL